MSINTILDKIEHLVVDEKRIPLTNRNLSEEMELVRLVRNLRQELPNEIQNAQAIMDNKDAILNEGRAEAEKIISQARDIAESMIEERKIVRESKEKADLIMKKATARHKEVTEDTFRLRVNVNNYVNQVFDQLILNVGNILAVLNQARDELQKLSIGAETPKE